MPGVYQELRVALSFTTEPVDFHPGGKDPKGSWGGLGNPGLVLSLALVGMVLDLVC